MSWLLEDVTLPGEEAFQLVHDIVALGQQAGLDDLIHVGTGEGEAGLETALNLGEVVGLGLLHLAEHGVDVFLRGHDHPGPALADRAELLGDGLQVEHQMGIGADELADLIDQKDEAVLRPLASRDIP